MLERTLTQRDMLKSLACEQLLGYSQLSPEIRYAQARTAQRLRNFFFTATFQPRSASVVTATNARMLGRTPAYSNSMILADIISLMELTQARSQQFLAMELFEFGGQERSQGLDYFGLTGLIPQRYLLKHEKNRSIGLAIAALDPVNDLQGRYIAYVPRLLAPYQQLECEWRNGGGGGSATDELFIQTGFRAVQSLPPDNPYGYFTTETDKRIKNYIASARPQTFFLEATLPLANFPAVGLTAQMKTPQMERPLLVLGASSNIEGCQAELVDELKYYTFTDADEPIARIPGIPLYKAPPLALWACNSDLRNYNLYHMWAVPHLLEPGHQLIIRLTNGLTPTPLGVFQETMRTRSEQAARVTFICRTV